MMLTEGDVRHLFEIAFDAATVDEVQASVGSYIETNREFISGVTRYIRFSNNYFRNNVEVRPYYPLRITVASKGRVGTSITNQIEPDAVRDAVRRAEAVARAGRPDPDWRPAAGPVTFPVIEGYDPVTAQITPAERTELLAGVVSRLRTEKLNGSGYLQVNTTLEAHANTNGLWFFRRATEAGYLVTVRSDSTMGLESSRVGSGWAGVGDMRRLSDLDVPGITAVASDKAKRSADPQPFPMGRYTVVLEPAAAGTLIGQLMNVLAGARSVDEWADPMEVGSVIADSRLTVRSMPAHPQILGSPYLPGGRVATDVVWIDEGVVRNVPGAASGPADDLVAGGGSTTLEDLIAGLDRGILVTQVSGTGLRTASPPWVNGLTRNGLFWVENGRIVRPLKNAWFSIRLDEAMRRLEGVSRPYKTGAFGYTGLVGSLMPALKISGFEFYLQSDAV